MRDIVVFCDREGYYGFLKPYIDSFADDKRYRFIIEKDARQERFLEYFGKDCTIWLDRFDALAVWASLLESNESTKLVCRQRGTEILDHDWARCRWEAFDGMVFSNRATEAVVFDNVDRLESMTQCAQLPPAVAVTPCNVSRKQQTMNIAYLSTISAEFNSLVILDILSELVKRDPAYKLFVIGEFQSTSLQIHFEHMITRMELAGNIEFHERPDDLPAWYADKSYILSTTLQAGNEAEIIRAMSLGVQPVVFNHFGAEHAVDTGCLANSVGECVARLSEEPRPPDQLRQRALERHNVLMYRTQFEELLDGPDQSSLPKVSILLPTYNRAGLLEHALSRLAKQTYQNCEIVVVNDCSTDETEKVVRQAQSEWKNIAYFKNEVNQGNASSMAKAAAIATGDFVIPFSDDDDLENSAVEELVGFWRRKKPDIIYCDLLVVDGAGVEQTRWQYRNYYRIHELLNTLVMADSNVIPETFFCRREIYDQVYTQTYSRRFINTYYLPQLRKLKMQHLPKALYRYAVHTGSTFSNAKGLFDRSKSTQNYCNAAMFMYAPALVMNIAKDRPASQQIAEAYASLAQVLTEHGKKRISGSMYTGAVFEAKDNLHWIYFYNAYHWMKMAIRYGYPEEDCQEIKSRILSTIDPSSFSPREHANLPDIYLRLPWFANKAFNNLSQFVALDMVTLGAPDWLNKPRFTVYHEGKAHIEVCNHICRTPDDLATAIGRMPVTIVNLFDAGAVEPTVRYLIENQLSSVHVFNFSRIRIPELELLRTVFNVGPRSFAGFDEYLNLTTELTTTSSYEHSIVETAV